MNQEREQFDAELRDWSMVDHGDDLRIHGAIYGDRLTSGKHPFPDGEPVVTSTVFSVVDGIARTRSGTRYKLSALRSGGEGWRPEVGDEVQHNGLGVRGTVEAVELGARVRWGDNSTATVSLRNLSPSPSTHGEG